MTLSSLFVHNAYHVSISFVTDGSSNIMETTKNVADIYESLILFY